ncbi:hypothetical protein PR048_027567 [Dryococelus australis]|uniref:Uncharacterized protein n=1 Tax=Dryococelus australis TaxID=614101 RepID=A0ABQ9GGV4_9NEOP|nr:hypothetical protein PR048_027567 [Dryococelus australis]
MRMTEGNVERRRNEGGRGKREDPREDPPTDGQCVLNGGEGAIKRITDIPEKLISMQDLQASMPCPCRSRCGQLCRRGWRGGKGVLGCLGEERKEENIGEDKGWRPPRPTKPACCGENLGYLPTPFSLHYPLTTPSTVLRNYAVCAHFVNFETLVLRGRWRCSLTPTPLPPAPDTLHPPTTTATLASVSLRSSLTKGVAWRGGGGRVVLRGEKSDASLHISKPGLEPGDSGWLGGSCVTSAGIKVRGKREIPSKFRRPAASPGTILTCENPRVIRPGIEPGSPRLGGEQANCSPVLDLRWQRLQLRLACSLHQGEPGSILGRVTLEFSHVGIVPEDATGRHVFSEISRDLIILGIKMHIIRNILGEEQH